jgi:formylglycine-generating enzyme required for sulfatase activity
MNFAAVSEQLRWLAKERDAGNLAPAKYRRARGRLLDELVGLSPRPIDLEVTQPRAAARTSTPNAPLSGEAELPAGRRGHGIRWLVLASLALIALLIAALLWLQRGEQHSIAHTPGASPTPGTAALSSVDVESIITDFLKRQDWSDKAVYTFNAVWRSLSDDDVVAALGNAQGQELSRQLAELLKRHAERDSGLVPVDANSPLLIMANNLKVAVPDGSVAPAVVAAPIAHEQVESSRSPASTASVPVPAPAAPAEKPAAPATIAAKPVAVAADSTTESSRTASSDPCSAANSRRRTCADILQGGRPGPILRVIKVDAFMMGSSETPEERPMHSVKLPRSFALMESEVSAGDYAYYCQQTHKTRPAAPWEGDTLPVVNVSWNEARDYAVWLSAQTGQTYRLPTEAEWEYAARAGSTGEPVPNPASEARYSTPGMARSSPVSVNDETYKPNTWGLHHMLGNVREWVEDGWMPDYSRAAADGSAAQTSGTMRAVRGGSYRDGPSGVRPGARIALDAGTRDIMTGFRLVRVVN